MELDVNPIPMPVDIRGQTAIVTGASGFVGARLIRALVEYDCDVIALVRRSGDLSRLQELVDDITIVEGDISDSKSFRPLSGIAGSPIFFHLGAAGVRTSDQDAGEIVRCNVDGTLNMLELALESNGSQFIYAGSCFEYGPGLLIRESEVSLNPRSVYAASKIGGELLVNQYASSSSLSAITLRLFNVYGPGESSSRLVPYAIGRALCSEDILLRSPTQERDFVFVDDVVTAFVTAASRPDLAMGTFNVCTGVGTSVRCLVDTILRLCGSKSTVIVGSQLERPDDYPLLVGDPSHASTELGWSSKTDLETGLKAFIQTHRSGNGYT